MEHVLMSEKAYFSQKQFIPIQFYIEPESFLHDSLSPTYTNSDACLIGLP